FLQAGSKLYLPSVSIDCIIFGFHENHLKVLLVRMKHTNLWGLPGGFILKEEHLDDAANRILKQRTGIDDLFLQQFHVFGHPDRSDKKLHMDAMRREGIAIDEAHWILQRFITVGYYALVEYSHVRPIPDTLSEDCAWWELDEVPRLIMDHNELLEKALASVRSHLQHHPVGYNLLPARFTMPELQKLYETILGKKLDRRNFQRRMLGYQVLRRLKDTRRGVAHKAPYLYSFDLKKYHKALKEGLKGGW
ncbi:MAG TPA: NUDIX domain-containing protein, partial [Chitinophagaceae bacterium]|nr:NUDIX domain-containing protein [Chitinophagaceae bacterium]